MRYCILVHGGVGSLEDNVAGCQRAVEAGQEILSGGGSALDAVVEATVKLEDEPSYNAGIGSRPAVNFECDMDASLMTSDGAIGIIAAIKNIRNPILVARKVMEETPHIFLAGEGANEFAARKGFEYFNVVTDFRREKLKELLGKVRIGEEKEYIQYRSILDACDTVGAVALDSHGGLAASNSTGGTNLQLPGRVGDTPVIGAGLYAGPCAAIVTTGLGEEIVRRMTAIRVYDAIAAGADTQKVCDDAVASYGEGFSFGILALTPNSAAWSASRSMPVAISSAGV